MPRFKNILYKSAVYAEGNVHIGDKYIIETKEKLIKLDLTQYFRSKQNTVIGRDKDLEKLQKIITPTTTRIIIRGPKGVGKTTFVRYFLAKNRAYFSFLVWVDVKDDIPKAFSFNAQLKDSLFLTSELASRPDDEKIVWDQFLIILNRLSQLKRKSPKSNNLIIIDQLPGNFFYPELNKSIAELFKLPESWTILAISNNGHEEFLTFPLSLPETNFHEKPLRNEHPANQLLKLNKSMAEPFAGTQGDLIGKDIESLLPDSSEEKRILFSLIKKVNHENSGQLLISIYQLLADDKFIEDRCFLVLLFGEIGSDQTTRFLKEIINKEMNPYVKRCIEDALKKV
jgi:nucleoside-triphosphatase THEP1